LRRKKKHKAPSERVSTFSCGLRKRERKIHSNSSLTKGRGGIWPGAGVFKNKKKLVET